MTTELQGIRIDAPGVRAIDSSKLTSFNIVESSDEVFQNFIAKEQEFLEALYSRPADTSHHPAYQSFGTVTLNGKVVAKIDNNGFVETSNAMGGRLLDQLPGDVNGKSGPILAEARAAKIAELLGGRVEKSSSALTQSQYEALPKPGLQTDYARMTADPAYDRLQKIEQARSNFLAQQMAQEEQDAIEDTGGSDAVKEFLDYMSKSPEERYFEAFLREKGLTPEQFAALPPEEREKILKEFEQRMEQEVAISFTQSVEALAEQLAGSGGTATAGQRSDRGDD
ncbi:MAG: hypothetical protein MI920_11515 [Kiloniellales bacterium]|nr:hypothetical protein [Kiloniellales bacterium]